MSAFFYFNGNYYKHLDDVAKGYLLGKITEILASDFICYDERYSLRNVPIAEAPIFYKCYDDDIFVMLKSENHLNTAL